MREVRTEGVICLTDGDTRIEYSLCDLSLTEREDGSFRWEFAPRWAVVDLLGPPLFEGIPGLNLELRRDVYAREGLTPVFVSERAPSENREDVRELLEEVGLDYLNKLEWLIRTDTRYSGDPLYVRARLEEDEVEEADLGDLSGIGSRSSQAMRSVLEHLAAGRRVVGSGFSLEGESAVAAHALLRALYLKEKKHLEERLLEGRRRAREEGRSLGRRPTQVDHVALCDAVERYSRGEIGVERAAAELGISRATFFRRMKALKGSEG